MDTRNRLAEDAIQKFLYDNRDLMALVKNLTIAELRKKIAAAMELNPEYTEEVMLHCDVDYLNQKGLAGRMARESFSRAMYLAVVQSFRKVQRNGQILFNVKWEDFPEAYAQLEALEVAAGERPSPPPAPAPKSAQELLEEQVRSDWGKLPTDKFKLKLNDRGYKATFDRLMSAGQIESHCTTLVDGSKGFNR